MLASRAYYTEKQISDSKEAFAVLENAYYCNQELSVLCAVRDKNHKKVHRKNFIIEGSQLSREVAHTSKLNANSRKSTKNIAN